MIAKLGKNALAAGALLTSTQTTVLMFTWSIMFAIGVMVARTHGEKDPIKVGRITREGLLLGLIMAIPMSVLIWFFPHILMMLHQPPAVVKLTHGYFHGLALGLLPSIWVVAYGQFAVGISRPKIMLAWACLNMPATILLGYLLIFGHWGFPAMGIAGFAYATSIVWWMLAIGLTIYFHYHKSFSQYHLLNFKDTWPLQYCMRLFQIGWPISIQFGAELMAWVLRTIMMGWFGVEVLAAQQIVMQIMILVLMFPIAVSQAAGVLVGQSLGRKEYYMTSRYGYSSVTIGGVFLLFIGCFYWFAPKLLMSSFINVSDPKNHVVVYFGMLLFFLGGFSQIFDGIRNIFTGALRGFQDTKMPMLVGLFVIWVIALPLGYMLGFVFHLGPAGVYGAFPLGVAIGAFILWRRFRYHMKCLASQIS